MGDGELGDLVARDVFVAHLANDLERSRRRGAGVALALMSPEATGLEDVRGVPARRELARRVAERLRDRVQASDTVAVLGPDLFGVILASVSDRAEAEERARRLARAVSTPFSIPGSEVSVSCRVVLALAPPEGRVLASTLLERAVSALGRAREHGATPSSLPPAPPMPAGAQAGSAALSA